MNITKTQVIKTEKDEKEYYSYEIIKSLDKDNGELLLVSCDLNKTGQKNNYLLKKIEFRNKKDENALITEIEKIKSLNCKYIVGIYDYFIEKKEQKETLCILMEYYEKISLEELIKYEEFLSQRNLWRIFIQIIIGLNSLHSSNIIIGNLNPQNIFLTKENEIKIFLTLDFVDNKKKDFSLMLYDSPEIINGEKYNQKSDIWSLACIFYELITKKKPFYLIENILKINYDKSQIIDDDFRYLI